MAFRCHSHVGLSHGSMLYRDVSEPDALSDEPQPVTDFLAKRPTLDANWRAVVLFGRNVASYKFALAKTLLGVADRPDDHMPFQDLAAPFARQCMSFSTCAGCRKKP